MTKQPAQPDANGAPKRTLPDAYHIAFDTKEFPGMIVATRVTLGKEVVRDDGKTFNVALAAHPLYRQLFDYCTANPPPGVRVNKRGNGGSR